MKTTAFALGSLACCSSLSAATLFSADFTGFTGAGFAPTPSAGQLDSDTFVVNGLSDDGTMNFGDTETSGDFARGSSSGGESTGGVYAFDTGLSGLGVGLGVQPGGSDFTPGDFQIRFTYSGVGAANDVTVSFDVAVFNDQNRANSFGLTDIDVDGLSAAFTGTTSLVSPGTADSGTVVWSSTSLSTDPLSTSLTPGQVVTLTFAGDDSTGGGSRDEFALDNVVVSATVVPEPAVMLLSGLGGLLLLRRWGRDAAVA